eukprot:1141174-Pelagomonas_calceolata.AAC.9
MSEPQRAAFANTSVHFPPHVFCQHTHVPPVEEICIWVRGESFLFTCFSFLFCTPAHLAAATSAALSAARGAGQAAATSKTSPHPCSAHSVSCPWRCAPHGHHAQPCHDPPVAAHSVCGCLRTSRENSASLVWVFLHIARHSAGLVWVLGWSKGRACGMH